MSSSSCSRSAGDEVDKVDRVDGVDPLPWVGRGRDGRASLAAGFSRIGA